MSSADPLAGARRSEELGYDLLAAADSQNAFGDSYCLLTAAALGTSRIELGPMVTNPTTRHPIVTASAIATVDQLSNGRAYLGIGTGRSAVANVGMSAASPEALVRALRIIASAFRPTESVRRGQPWPSGLEIDEGVAPLHEWAARRVPVLVAASGPKALGIAAEMADGVILSPGDVGIDDLPRRIEQIRALHARGPRAGDPFEIRQNLRVHVSSSIEESKAVLLNVVSAHARYTKPGEVPDHLREPLDEYHRGYQWVHHGGRGSSVNPDRLVQLGLFEFMLERYGVYGDLESVVRRVEQFEAAGVDTVMGVPPEALAMYRSRHRIGGSGQG